MPESETLTLNNLAHIPMPMPVPVPDRREELRAQLARCIASLIGAETSLTTAVRGLTLHRYTGPTAPLAGTYEPSVALVVQGRKRVSLGHMSFEYNSSRFLLTCVDLPVISEVIEGSPQAPYLCVRLELDIPMVRELLSREPDLPVWSDASEMGMTTAETTVEFLDAFSRLIGLQHVPQDIAFMSALIQREIIYRILQSAEGQRLREIATLGENSQRTANAVEWIRDHYAEPLRIEELAQVACMGVSTLHHHFRALTSMSPLQYQKRLRLHEARRRMLADGIDAASAGFEVGYESASQFNREYSRFFGKPPLRDVRALRVAGAGESN